MGLISKSSGMKLNFSPSTLPLLACFILIFAWSNNIQYLSAQNLARTSYLTIEDGLGFRNITSVVQDNRGLIWIGTGQGFERFDGKEFLRFNNKISADIYFPGELIKFSCIVPYKKDYYLIVADERLYKLDICTYSWEELVLPKSLRGNVATIMAINDDKIAILVTSANKNSLIIYENDTFTKIFESSYSSINLNFLEKDKDENIWWATPHHGITVIDNFGKQLAVYKPDSTFWYGNKIYSLPIFISKNNDIYLFPKSANEVWQFFPQENKIKVVLKDLQSHVYHGLEDSQGFCWFATKTELVRCNLSKGKGYIVDYSDQINKGLYFTKINGLFEDESKILWVSTNNGLIKLPLGQPFIENHLVQSKKEWGNEMRGIFQTNSGSIYSYCENGNPGLYNIDVEKGKVVKIEPKPIKGYAFDMLENAKIFVYNKKDNHVYFLTDHLVSINMSNYVLKVETYFGKITERFNKNPFTILKDGTFVIGTKLSQVIKYNRQTKESTKLITSQPSYEGVNINYYLQDLLGRIWVGTTKGLYVFDQNGEFIHHLNINSSPALSNDNVLNLYLDSQQNMWVGTFGGGVNLIRFNKNKHAENTEKMSFAKTISIEIINTSNGLCNENVPGILEDDNGKFWFATFEGLAYYNPQNKTFQTYNTSDGISNDEFNYASYFKDNEGMLWFGGLNGLNKINPNAVVINDKAPALTLLSFIKYSRESQKQERLLITEDIHEKIFEISPYDNWFQFNWTLPSYLNNHKNTYYTRLEGIDEEWNYIGNTAYVRYNNLPHGQYTLHVKGMDSKGNASIRNLSIPIIVYPFYYQTWWFYSLVFCTFLGLVYLIFRYNLAKKLAMERMRTQIASDLHDELGSMLSGLAMQGELLQTSSTPKIKERLQMMSTISRNVVGKMRDLVWSIDSRRDSFGSLVERMKEQAEDLFQNEEIHLVFEVGDVSLNKELPVNLRQQLFLIYNEAINNIVRHSDCNEVTVKIGNFDPHFVMSIKDNGTVNGKSCHKTGLGISNMEMRAKKLGAQIEFNQEGGYCVLLKMKKL